MSKITDVEFSERPAMLEEKLGHELLDIELMEGKRSKKGLLLRPQPSNDPNDPLVGASSTPPSTQELTPT
jgi:hypothetical protein